MASLLLKSLVLSTTKSISNGCFYENPLPLSQGNVSLTSSKRHTTSIRAQKAPDGRKGFGPTPEKKYQRGDRAAPQKREVDSAAKARDMLERNRAAVEASSKGGQEGGKRPRELEVLEPPPLSEDSQPPSGDDSKLFEQRLQALRRSVPQKQQQREGAQFGPIDYDAPPRPLASGKDSTGSFTESLGFKVGAGIGAAVFAAIFAFGDLLPSAPPAGTSTQEQQLSDKDKKLLQDQVDRFEAILKDTPGDKEALEGAAVSYAELGQLDKAASSLESLLKGEEDPEAIRLLAEVRSAQGSYSTSASLYRRAIRASPGENILFLQGLTDALITDGKPGEAVGEILAARTRIQSSSSSSTSAEGRGAGGPEAEAESGESSSSSIDPTQVELLLGKAYAAWKKPGDAVAVYDALIAARPDDFRGYLAKGVLLKDQGQKGEAERMFVQARFRAPETAKALVDRLANRT